MGVAVGFGVVVGVGVGVAPCSGLGTANIARQTPAKKTITPSKTRRFKKADWAVRLFFIDESYGALTEGQSCFFATRICQWSIDIDAFPSQNVLEWLAIRHERRSG
jgi:hypothetical protein